jgi:type VI secretion system secreted protein VgrG
VLAIIVVIAALVAYSIMRAQTVPPTPTLLPGCGASGGQPKKCQTDTPVPTDTLGETIPSLWTDTPEPTNTKEESTPEPTDTLIPTSTPRPTDTPRPTNTKEEPTDTPRPTVELPTLTPTETEIPPCPQ